MSDCSDGEDTVTAARPATSSPPPEHYVASPNGGDNSQVHYKRLLNREIATDSLEDSTDLSPLQDVATEPEVVRGNADPNVASNSADSVEIDIVEKLSDDSIVEITQDELSDRIAETDLETRNSNKVCSVLEISLESDSVKFKNKSIELIDLTDDSEPEAS